MLKKSFYALIAFFLFVFGFVSCSFNEKQTNVSIKIPSQVCNTVFSAREADSPLVKQSIQVKLYVNSKPAFQKTSEYDGKDLSLSFDSIPLGAQVYAEAFFLEKEGDVEKIIASAKSKTITVEKDSNNLEIVITIEKVDPNDPGNTTNPDNPTNPDDNPDSGTTEPTNPTDPTNPDNPTNPDDNTGGDPTNPDNPNNPDNPTDPNDNTDPDPDQPPAPVIKESAISFVLNGGEWVSSYTAPEKYTEGTGIILPDASNIVREGYGFNGWTASFDGGVTLSETVINQIGKDASGDIILYANWSQGVVNYKVIHLLQNLENDEYTQERESTLVGKAGETTNAQALEYQGFRAKTIVQQTIKEDDSTIVSIYYDRNCHSVIYDDGLEDEVISVPQTMTHRYGATINVDFAGIGSRGHWYVVGLKNGSEQYSASGKTSFVMPDEDVTLTVQWAFNGGLYVSGLGDDDTGDGSQDNPFATVDKACEEIEVSGDSESEWVINISGSITGKITGSASGAKSTISVSPEHARSILVTGQDSSAEINRKLPRTGTNSGNSDGTVLVVDTSVPVSIKNLKLTKGSSSGNVGGAIHITSGSTVTLGDGVVIYDNRADYGGGVYNAGTLYINGTALIGSLTDEKFAAGYESTSYSANYGSSGGGIYNEGNLYLGYSEYNESKKTVAKWTGKISYNYSTTGGAIYNTKDGVVVMNSGELCWNASGSSGSGGGAVYNLGSFTMTGNSVIENNCSNDKNGGGFSNEWKSATEYGTFTFAGGRISKNETTSPHSDTGHGGGVFNSSIMYVYGNAVIGDPKAPSNNVTASGKEASSNYAAGYGGGICVDGSNAQLYLGYGNEAWTGGIYYNYAEDNTTYTGGGGLAIRNSATVIMKSGTIAYNGTNRIGKDVYLGSNSFTIGGTAQIPGEIGQYSHQHILQIDNSLSHLGNNAISFTPISNDAKTEYYSSTAVIALTDAAKDAGITLSDVIPKFYITPLVETATGKVTKWSINPENGKMVMNTSAGISASLDTGVEDIVVKKGSTVLQDGQLIENQTGSFTLSLYSVAGQSVSSEDPSIQCIWFFDGQPMQPPKIGKNGVIEIPGSVPDGVEFTSSTSIKITCTSSSDPTIAPGLHDIILMVDDETDIYSFWLQIKK